jgi:hypothetical protein
MGTVEIDKGALDRSQSLALNELQAFAMSLFVAP